jgi:TetR/AcrR family transcriptional regulator, regulator of biofilm formation and stress response
MGWLDVPRTATTHTADPVTLETLRRDGPAPALAGSPVRTGRIDPHRRERIASAAIEVVAVHGVEGLTHRRVAAAAGVPLGSTTYHYATLDDLLAAGLEAAAAESAAYLKVWEQTLADLDLVEATTELIVSGMRSQRQRIAVRYELYVAALRRPRLRAISTEWSRLLADIYRQYTDDLTADALSAAVDGLWLGCLVSDEPVSTEQIERVLRRIVAADGDGQRERESD